MRSMYLNFLKQLVIYSLILGIIALAVSFFLPRHYLSPTQPFLFPFFISATLISFRILSRTLDKRFARFVNTFMLITALKLLLYIAVMVIYLLINRQDTIPFIISFFILYLCYTVFESVCIMKALGPAKAPGKDPSGE